MADERGGEPPAPPRGPAPDAPTRVEPPSVPTRVLPSSGQPGGTGVVPLARRRRGASAARGLRPPAEPAVIRPTRRDDQPPTAQTAALTAAPAVAPTAPVPDLTGMPTDRVVTARNGAAPPRPAPIAPPPPEPPAAPAPAEPAPVPSPTASPASPATGSPRPVRQTTVAARDAEWAATSTALASMRSRLGAWNRSWSWRRTGRMACALSAVLVLGITGLGWGATSWLEAAVRQIGALDLDSSAIRDAAAQQGDQNFLVVGSDTRIGAQAAQEIGDSSDVPGARADTVMVVHVPEDRRGVTVVAFPRDLEVTRPECERWDSQSGRYTGETIPRTPKVKLNTAYAAGGPRCVTKVVQELSGLAVNRFLGVDFQGFSGMVDAVGGVPVCTERAVRDSILGTVVPRSGTSTLSGSQALNFVRARHVQGDPSSDYGRIQRQQRFLSALLRTTLSAGTLLDPGKLRGFVDAVSRSTFGENIGADQLVTLSQSLGNLDPRTVSFTTVPTTGKPNERGNEVRRVSAERELFASIIDDRPLPGAAPTAPPPAAPGAPAPPAARPPAPAPVTPEQVRATLVDGRSGDSGQGSGSVAEELREQGFDVESDDRSAESESTSIRFSPDQAGAAALLSRSVPDATMQPGAPGSGTLTLTLGDDFDELTREDAEPAPPVVPTITAADATCS